MTQGNFFFVHDDFFRRFDSAHNLMKNKEGGNNRPCFYAFSDSKVPEIIWCIPISSQVSKFDQIVQHKLSVQKARGIDTPKCDTIQFGHVMGQRRAFLIQNMFPITAPYIMNVYIDRNTQNPVSLPPNEETAIRKSAKEVLKLVFRGYKNLVFADVVKIYNSLSTELKNELIQVYNSFEQEAAEPEAPEEEPEM